MTKQQEVDSDIKAAIDLIKARKAARSSRERYLAAPPPNGYASALLDAYDRKSPVDIVYDENGTPDGYRTALARRAKEQKGSPD